MTPEETRSTRLNRAKITLIHVPQSLWTLKRRRVLCLWCERNRSRFWGRMTISIWIPTSHSWKNFISSQVTCLSSRAIFSRQRRRTPLRCWKPISGGHSRMNIDSQKKILKSRRVARQVLKELTSCWKNTHHFNKIIFLRKTLSVSRKKAWSDGISSRIKSCKARKLKRKYKKCKLLKRSNAFSCREHNSSKGIVLLERGKALMNKRLIRLILTLLVKKTVMIYHKGRWARLVERGTLRFLVKRLHCWIRKTRHRTIVATRTRDQELRIFKTWELLLKRKVVENFNHRPKILGWRAIRWRMKLRVLESKFRKKLIGSRGLQRVKNRVYLIKKVVENRNSSRAPSMTWELIQSIAKWVMINRGLQQQYHLEELRKVQEVKWRLNRKISDNVSSLTSYLTRARLPTYFLSAT